MYHKKLKAMWELNALTDHKKLEFFLAVYFSAYFLWMASTKSVLS